MFAQSPYGLFIGRGVRRVFARNAPRSPSRNVVVFELRRSYGGLTTGHTRGLRWSHNRPYKGPTALD
ncbi:hypothetical protein LSAT2_025384 [Lamellibrachia satsuma]|nr:hypothetical protein LSAT2_025384 [Lamellibrachia satsuma]